MSSEDSTVIRSKQESSDYAAVKETQQEEPSKDTSEEQTVQDELVPGLVSGMLPWYWKSMPGPIVKAAAVASAAYTKLKSSHPICTEALGAAEKRVLTLAQVVVNVTDRTARAMDQKIKPLIEESQLRYLKVDKVQQYLVLQWKRREELQIVAVEKITSTSAAQLSLRLADNLFSIMEKWTVYYQKRFISSSRRWIRRTRRSGLPKHSEGRKIVSPRKRVKFSQCLWDLLTKDTITIAVNGKEPTAEANISTEDRKRKADEVCSESDTSTVDTDYEQLSTSTDSMEHLADEQIENGEVEDEVEPEDEGGPSSPVDTYSS